MRLIKTVLLGTLLSFPASYAQACAVDGLAGQTDTTITISWNLSGCKKLSAGETFEVCWKEKGDWNFPCGANRIGAGGESGTTTITGLQPGQTYKVRTKWHQRSWGWQRVTNRIVTTNRTEASSSDFFILNYVKDAQNCVTFVWKYGPAATSPSTSMPAGYTLHLEHRSAGTLGIWVSADNTSLDGAAFMAGSRDFSMHMCAYKSKGVDHGFRPSDRYRASIHKGTEKSSASNIILWN